MIAVDTNILLHAHRSDSPWHIAANQAMSSLGLAPWAIAWPCVHEFLAIATHPKIFAPPTPVPDALATLDQWQASPSLQLIGETSEHWPVLAGMVRDGHVTGPRVHDARIAALCLEHGVSVLWSADRDFSRFPKLKVQNPLVAPK